MFTVRLPLPSRRELERRFALRVPVFERVLDEMERRINDVLADMEAPPTVKWRLKRFDSLYEKLLRRARETRSPDGGAVTISDLLGIRVVCPFVEEIAIVEGRLRAAFDVVEVERKGAELNHTEFGYSSVHLLIAVPDDVARSRRKDKRLLCEVQLRTILQDAWAEVEHEVIYKTDMTPLDGTLRRKLAALNANLTLSDIIFQEIRDYQRSLHAQLMKRREQFWMHLEQEAEATGCPPGPDVEMIRTGSNTIDNLLLNALNAHNRKDYDTAVRIYTDILAYEPAAAIAAVVHAHRGMARYAMGERDGAIDDFTQTIKLSPRTNNAYYLRGVVYRAVGRSREAMSDFSRCLELDPYHLETRVARARLHRELRNRRAAEADCEMALKIEPDNRTARKLYRELKDETDRE